MAVRAASEHVHLASNTQHHDISDGTGQKRCRDQHLVLDILPALCRVRHTFLTDRPGFAVMQTGGPVPTLVLGRAA